MSTERPDFLRLVFADEEIYQIDAAQAKSTPESAETGPGVIAEAQQESVTLGTPPEAQGSLESKVLVLVSEADHTFAEPGDLTFLQDILKAIKLSINEVALVNVKRCTPDQLHYLSGSPFEQVILFGAVQVEDALFPEHQSNYIIHKREQKAYLRAEGLEAIRLDRNKKMSLWNALKELFLK